MRRRANTLVPYPPRGAVKQRAGEEAPGNHAFKDTRPDKNGSKKRAGAPARVREEAPALVLERTAGLEPTPPYGKYGALQSCVRKNHSIPYTHAGAR